MSILENVLIDGMGIRDDEKELVFMVTDHLEWKNEGEHLFLLQDKLNAYLAYIEAREFQDVYPKQDFESFCIEVYFEYSPTENCVKFFEVMNQQLEAFHIKVIGYCNE